MTREELILAFLPHAMRQNTNFLDAVDEAEYAAKRILTEKKEPHAYLDEWADALVDWCMPLVKFSTLYIYTVFVRATGVEWDTLDRAEQAYIKDRIGKRFQAYRNVILETSVANNSLILRKKTEQ